MSTPTQPELDPAPVLSRWDLLPLLGAAALLQLAQTLWARLPDPLPTHFGMDGRPNGWTSKGTAPWLMFGFPALIWILLLGVGAWKRLAAPGRASLQRRIIAPMRGLTVLGLLVLMSLVVLIPVFGPIVFRPALGAFFALLFLGIGLTVRMGYLGATEEVRRLWKWGIFYVNPEDPRLWVPKRLGIGWTLNFSRPIAWVIMGLLLLLPLILLVLIRTTAR